MALILWHIQSAVISIFPIHIAVLVYNNVLVFETYSVGELGYLQDSVVIQEWSFVRLVMVRPKEGGTYIPVG